MHKTPNAVFFFFGLLLIAPDIGQWLHLDPISSQSENRRSAEKPKFSLEVSSLKELPKSCRFWINDNFGFRNALLRGNFLLRYELLGVSPSADVVLGRNGWLYYAAELDSNDCRGMTVISNKQLGRWTRTVLKKKDWLAKKGIKYILVIAPNKSTIYPDFLPAAYNWVKQDSFADDLINYIRNNSDIAVVDLKKPLLRYKQRNDLYFKTDSHWNSYGAFIAYKEIIASFSAWFPDVNPLRTDDFEISTQSYNGDLSGMMGGQGLLHDDEYTFIPKKPFNAFVSEKRDYQGSFTMRAGSYGQLKAVIFRDSFFNALLPFVAEHFSVSRYISKDCESLSEMDEIIEKYRPEIIIEEIVERNVKNSICRQSN
jgi:alginate O-acetyltransferase complex protein AlgJ